MTLEWTDNGLLVFDCARCDGTGEARAVADYCARCGGAGHDFWNPEPLVRNLVVVGALTTSWARGTHSADWRPNVDGLVDVPAVRALLGEARR